MIIFFLYGFSELWEYVNMECASYVIEEQAKLENAQAMTETEPTEQPKPLLSHNPDNTS
jgi:hypothetical protein